MQARGERIEPFLTDAGIPGALLAQPCARVSGEQYVALYRSLVRRRADESVGYFSRPFKLGSFALIVRSALGAPDLEAASARIANAFWLLQDDLCLELRREDGLAGIGLRFTDAALAQPPFLHEMLLRIFWRLMAWLAGGKLPLARFDFAFARPAHAHEYARAFPGRCEFGRASSAFWFAEAWLRRGVYWDEVAAQGLLADAQANFLLSRHRDGGMGTRVRNHLRRVQPAWPDLGTVAGALHMSVATLQRRLALEGVSYQSLKDELRRDIAIARLSSSAVPLLELAQELGFVDSAVFQRAFKGWTGSAPGAYRKGRSK